MSAYTSEAGRMEADTKPVEDEVVCPVCMLLLLDPTTLNCGHSVCRGCLAAWYLSHRPRRLECPTCRQKWQGYPQISTSMRSMIERLYPEEIAQRRKELEENDDYNTRKNLDLFEKELKQKQKIPVGTPPNHNFGFFGGVVVAVIAAAMVSYLLSWGSGGLSSGKGRGDMPVLTWKAPDVAQWLNYLGWARNYSDNAKLQQIDGRELMNMEMVKLMDALNVTDEYHRNALRLAVLSLRESRVQMPKTIWEYKALYPGRSLYLSQGIKDTPRCAMLFLYLFYYEDCFLPFLHSTVPHTWEEQIQLRYKLPSPTWSQFLMFVVMMLVFPYGMAGLFAWTLRSAHTLSHLVVMLSCFLQTLFELSVYSNCLLNRRWRVLKQLIYKDTKTVLTLLGFMFVWPVIPYLVASVWFYFNMYYTPLVLLKNLYHTLIRPRHHH